MATAAERGYSFAGYYSAMWSIASRASIGREGPIVQLSAMIASLIGSISKTDRILALAEQTK